MAVLALPIILEPLHLYVKLGEKQTKTKINSYSLAVLLNSFKPAGASIHSVTVYPSDFGLERMAKEDIQGPVGLGGGENSSDEGEEGEEGEEYSEEKLRKYQLSRFK